MRRDKTPTSAQIVGRKYAPRLPDVRETVRATLLTFPHSAGAGFLCQSPAGRLARFREEPPTEAGCSHQGKYFWRSRDGWRRDPPSDQLNATPSLRRQRVGPHI